MNIIARRTIVLASLFSLTAGGCASDLRAEGEKQASGIYSAPSRMPILSRIPVPKNDNGFTQFTSIEVPGALLTRAYGINNRGQIVGAYLDESRFRGFLLDRGTFTSIHVPGAWSTLIYRINNSGQMIGEYSGDTPGGDRSFFLDGDTVTLIQFPDSDTLAWTAAYGINDRGQIVGYYIGEYDYRYHGFLLDDGVYTTIDVPGAEDTEAVDINNKGQIVGGFWRADLGHWAGFVFEDGVFTIIDLPNCFFMELLGNNSRGQVVGGVKLTADPTALLGLLFDRGVLSSFVFPSAISTVTWDINDEGKIVGSFWADSDDNGFGFVAE